MDAVPLLCLRFFRVGTVGSLAAWRPSGGGAETRHAVAGRVPRAVGRTARDGAEPDAVGVLSAHAGGSREPAVGRPACTSRRCIWRRGAGAGTAGAVVSA